MFCQGEDSDPALYELQVGYNDNTQTCIKDMIGCIVSVATPGVLACEESRDFWVSWQSGIFKAGTGRVYDQNRFFEPVIDQDVDIKYIGFMTTDGIAEWNIKDTVGK